MKTAVTPVSCTAKSKTYIVKVTFYTDMTIANMLEILAENMKGECPTTLELEILT